MSWNAWIKAFLQLHPSDRQANQAKIMSIPVKYLRDLSADLNSAERMLLAKRALEFFWVLDATVTNDAMAVLAEVFPYFDDLEGRALAMEIVQRLSPQHPEFEKTNNYGVALVIALRTILPYLSMPTRVELIDLVLQYDHQYQIGLSSKHPTRHTTHVTAWLEIFKQLDGDQQGLRVAQIKGWLQSLNSTGRLAVVEQFLPPSGLNVNNPFIYEPADDIFQTLLTRGVLDTKHDQRYIISYDESAGIFTFSEKVSAKGWSPLNLGLGRKIRVQAPRRLKPHYLSTLLEYLERLNEKGCSAFDRKPEMYQPAPTEADPHPQPVTLDYIPLESELLVHLTFNPGDALDLRLASYLWPDNPMYFEVWRREFPVNFQLHHPHIKSDVAFSRFIEVMKSASRLPALILGAGAGLTTFFHEGVAEAALAFLNPELSSSTHSWGLGFFVLGGVFAFLSRKVSKILSERSQQAAAPDLDSVERFWQEGLRQFEQEEQVLPFRQEASLPQRRQLFYANFLDRAFDEYEKDRQGLRLWLAAQLEEKGLDDPRWLEGLPDALRCSLAGKLASLHIDGYQGSKGSSWTQVRDSLYKTVAYLNPTLDLTPIIAKEKAADIEIELLAHTLASDYLPYMSRRERELSWLGKGYNYFEAVKSLLNQAVYRFFHLSPEQRYQNRTLGYYLLGQFLKHSNAAERRWVIDLLINVCDQNTMVQPIESLFGMLEGLNKDELQNEEVNFILSLLGVSDPKVVDSVESRTTLVQWVASVEFEARVDQLIAFYGGLRWEEMYVRFYRGKKTRYVLPQKKAPRVEEEPNSRESDATKTAQDPNQWSQQIGNLTIESTPSPAEELPAAKVRVASEPPPAVAAPPAQPKIDPEEWLDDDSLEEWVEQNEKKAERTT